MKANDAQIGLTVEIKDLRGVPDSFKKATGIKVGDQLIIAEIKDTGGLLFAGIEHPVNFFGNEQGLMPKHVKILQP